MSGGPSAKEVLLNCITSSKNNTYIYYFAALYYSLKRYRAHNSDGIIDYSF
jgi:hypothetical protein